MKVLAYHHSHNEFFRNPFGAVKCGNSIRLRIFFQSARPVEECFLRLWIEEKEYRYPMDKVRLEPPDGQGGETFEVDYVVPDEPGLVWYFFIFRVGAETYFYGNTKDCLGGAGEISQHEPPGYQITVYRPMNLPSWYTHGIMYQIYVDRFFNGDEQGKALNPRPKSLLHGDWYDTPFYIKNKKGEVQRWDFFGGNLLGVLKKLPYLKELGISIIYFNPIFDASSNHKYDTGDYLTIDPMYGDAEIFKRLVQEAQSLAISIILDGVFSHTGDDSIYFNRYGNYSSLGAYQSQDSRYYSWYKWKGKWEYSCWWGVKTLPEVNEMEPSYREFIIHSPEGVLQTWMKYGVKGWRLDVADELPDEFIQEFRTVMKTIDPEAVLIGEVWEDPTTKYSYGKLRQYFWGSELDGTMNYPFREVFLKFLLVDIDACQVHERIMNLYENYPRENFFGQMNLIGSHDRARILTLLGEAPSPEELTVSEQENYHLTSHNRWLATQRLKIFALIQMSFPGVPCLYYGDEAGLEGYPDPFNRGAYPWGREDQEILQWVKRVLRYRQEYEVLQEGEFFSWSVCKDVYAFKRRSEKEEITVLVNRSAQESQVVELVMERDVHQVIDLFKGIVIYQRDSGSGFSSDERPKISLTVPPLTGKALFCQKHSVAQYFKQEILTRSCGILMHISSLPSPWGIGDLGPEAYNFVDFLNKAGQSLWQVLPLNPLGLGDSPYQSESAFAGNPLLISIDFLIQVGLLTGEEAAREYARQRNSHENTGFAWVKTYKEVLLRLAFSRFIDKTLRRDKMKKTEEGVTQSDVLEYGDYLDPNRYQDFKQANQEWLNDYALYKCLKIKNQGSMWKEWREEYCLRDSGALEAFASESAEAMDYIFFVQYTFEYQWQRLRHYANAKGIKIIGDIPIFVAYDSSDTWANREIFALDAHNAPKSSAGVPPDYFSPTGQNWGNPLYNWDALAVEDYAWWKLRFKQALRRFDVLRLDHFRGFEAYWEIPAQAKTAEEGRWMKGPGKRFFESLVREFGPLPLIAEDLGTITPEVNTLKAIFGFPGMKVIQFFSHEDHEYKKGTGNEKEKKNVVWYSGTHDNDTLLGWYQSQGYDSTHSVNQVKKTIEELYKCQGAWVILPLQDVLKLDSKSRMNIPGTIEGNWNWRVEKIALGQKVWDELRSLAERYGRCTL